MITCMTQSTVGTNMLFFFAIQNELPMPFPYTIPLERRNPNWYTIAMPRTQENPRLIYRCMKTKKVHEGNNQHDYKLNNNW